MKTRKMISLLLVLTMCTALLSACGGGAASSAASSAAPAESSAAASSEAAAPESQPAESSAPAEAAPAAEAMTLKIGYGISDTTTMGKAVQEWADKVTADTEGRIAFEIYPSGQLGSMTEIIEAVDLGQLDIALGDSSLMTETVPELNLLSMPMLIKDFEGWKNLAHGEVGEALKAKVAEESNITCLGWMFNGFREVISTNEISSLESCKGTIIRSPEADVYIQTLTNMNFTPTALAFAEVYSALQTGVVQACETSYEQFIQNSFYEIATHMLESNHMAATMSILINTKIWDKIADEDKAIIQADYDEIMSKCDEAVNGEAEGYKNQLMTEYGCDCYNYTEEEQAVLVERFQAYWDQAAAANNFADLLAKAIEIR